MGLYISDAALPDERDHARVDQAIDRALRTLRQHQPNIRGVCDPCGGPCTQREAALAVFSRFMREPALVRPYIKA